MKIFGLLFLIYDFWIIKLLIFWRSLFIFWFLNLTLRIRFWGFLRRRDLSWTFVIVSILRRTRRYTWRSVSLIIPSLEWFSAGRCLSRKPFSSLFYVCMPASGFFWIGHYSLFLIRFRSFVIFIFLLFLFLIWPLSTLIFSIILSLIIVWLMVYFFDFELFIIINFNILLFFWVILYKVLLIFSILWITNCLESLFIYRVRDFSWFSFWIKLNVFITRKIFIIVNLRIIRTFGLFFLNI